MPGIPTDCPQRDERLGFLGNMLVFAHNPDLRWGHGDGALRHNDYSDWLSAGTLTDPAALGLPEQPAEVPRELFATAQFYRSTATLARMAGVLGRDADRDRYASLAGRIRTAFQNAYVADDGTVLGETQAGYALALHLDLVPETLRERAVRRMVDLVEAFDVHVSTGIHTTPMLLSELERNGHVDLAYRLLLRRTCPSWGFMLEQDGTTIWERWDGYVEGRGYQNVRMNSFCHYALGAVGEWVYRHVLVINPVETAPGARRFVLRPRLGGGLTFARGSYASIRGTVESDWSLDGDTLTWGIHIPANTEATVHVPGASVDSVRESGTPVRGRDDLWWKVMDDGAAVFHVGSGSYEFVSERVVRTPGRV